LTTDAGPVEPAGAGPAGQSASCHRDAHAPRGRRAPQTLTATRTAPWTRPGCFTPRRASPRHQHRGTHPVAGSDNWIRRAVSLTSCSIPARNRARGQHAH
jgi:hypothetical protein